MTAVSDETGRGWLPLKYEDGPDFCTVTFATGAAFALTVHPERMKLMEAALSAAPVAQEPVAWRYEIQHGPDGETDWAWVYDAENNFVCTAKTYHAAAIVRAATPPATPAGTPANRGDRVIYWLKRYQADEHLDDDACEELDALINVLSKGVKVQPSAGVGADEIARADDILAEAMGWHPSENGPSHGKTHAKLRAELLALLSRAGDQSNSTHEA